jgi:23S rRNA pseudouridine2604 synthase
MSEGIKIPASVGGEEDYVTKKCIVQKIAADRFSIILTEGKKHQIRRMCDALGYGISNLQRRRIMNIKLGTLMPGDFREIKGKELDDFLKSLDL